MNDVRQLRHNVDNTTIDQQNTVTSLVNDVRELRHNVDITRDQQDTLTSLENDIRELHHTIYNVTNGMTEIGSKLSSKLSSIFFN